MKKLIAVAGLALATIGATVTGQTNTGAMQQGRSVCVPYDPASLKLDPLDNGVWQLSRGDGAIFRVFDSRDDAEAGLTVAKAHTQLCYIGKSNTRPNRQEYIMEYWK